jgi:hypothetical protein
MSKRQREKKVGGADRELTAMAAIMESLGGLDGEAIRRVLDYVTGRLSLGRTTRVLAVSPSGSVSPSASVTDSNPSRTHARVSVRDLKDEKQPASSNQMAALVAYYLSELAPEADRRDTIGATEIQKYFKQAAFPLPKVPQKTLPNAVAAGYFDLAGGGQFRLNPVGYNLVVHGLPPASGSNKKRGKKAAR